MENTVLNERYVSTLIIHSLERGESEKEQKRTKSDAIEAKVKQQLYGLRENFRQKLDMLPKTAINLILIFSTFLFTPISEFGADFGPETTHQKQHNESKESEKNSWNKET